MDGLSKVRLELNINAQRIMQEYQLHNDALEESIKVGIERAFEEIFEEDNFEDLVTHLVKQEIRDTVKRAASDWSLRHTIHDKITEAIEGRIEDVAKGWAEKVTKNLK